MEGIVKIVDRAYADTLARLRDQVQRGRADFLPVRRNPLSKPVEREARPSGARRPSFTADWAIKATSSSARTHASQGGASVMVSTSSFSPAHWHACCERSGCPGIKRVVRSWCDVSTHLLCSHFGFAPLSLPHLLAFPLPPRACCP